MHAWIKVAEQVVTHRTNWNDGNERSLPERYGRLFGKQLSITGHFKPWMAAQVCKRSNSIERTMETLNHDFSLFLTLWLFLVGLAALKGGIQGKPNPFFWQKNAKSVSLKTPTHSIIFSLVSIIAALFFADQNWSLVLAC